MRLFIGHYSLAQCGFHWNAHPTDRNYARFNSVRVRALHPISCAEFWWMRIVDSSENKLGLISHIFGMMQALPQECTSSLDVARAEHDT